MKKARYICFEGTEGVGKTTQTNLLAQQLIAQGYKVLLTKEPGTVHSPLTMVLRTVMLDQQYSEEITATAREYVSQAIRSIHLEKVVYPSLDKYDFIIQDRGMLSGLAYGVACGGFNVRGIEQMMNTVAVDRNPYALYDSVIYLTGNVAKGLATAKSAKQEFKAGDAIEAKGIGFMNEVASNMSEYSKWFNGVIRIDVDNKSIQQVSKEILNALDIKDVNDGYED